MFSHLFYKLYLHVFDACKEASLLEFSTIIIITNHATLSLFCFSLVYFVVYKEAEIVAQRLQ